MERLSVQNVQERSGMRTGGAMREHGPRGAARSFNHSCPETGGHSAEVCQFFHQNSFLMVYYDVKVKRGSGKPCGNLLSV